ncbi:hypothetical protein C8J33_10838 [Rhizobium sp. PP-CC-3G-465]|nr:hypothetical protein C8J37_111109 [Rhizobium sp. PP-WC-1G-195]TCQ20070.1 hypothetical protein C8J33_10838 [Rhizobium sp. PP-CC-3G-465]
MQISERVSVFEVGPGLFLPVPGRGFIASRWILEAATATVGGPSLFSVQTSFRLTAAETPMRSSRRLISPITWG